MPNIKSAKKRVLITEVRTARNRAVKTNLKTVLKKANAAIESDAANSTEAVRLAVKKIDQACAKGILKKNTAARRKSSLARKVNAANAKTA